METKKELRKKMLELRSAIPVQYRKLKSQQLCDQILSSEIYVKSTAIYGFIPFGSEIDITRVLTQAVIDGKRTAVPRVHGDTMDFYYIRGASDLEPGFKGILEPKKDMPLALDECPFILAPGVAFTRSGYRMGYGKGFYDKYLASHKAFAVGVCFEEQLLPEIPTTSTDICLNGILWA